MDDDKVKVFEAGMDDYIPKPIDPYELYRKVVKNISHKLSAQGELLQNQYGNSDQVINLPALIKSFKDDPAFVSDYLYTFEREFTDLPVEIIRHSQQRNVKALSDLIHKINPSIRRFENTDLLKQLNELKEH